MAASGGAAQEKAFTDEQWARIASAASLIGGAKNEIVPSFAEKYQHALDGEGCVKVKIMHFCNFYVVSSLYRVRNGCFSVLQHCHWQPSTMSGRTRPGTWPWLSFVCSSQNPI